jgi:hypothetical protein
MNHEMLTVFLHIPKTGGTTLSEIFRREYKDGELFDHNTLYGKGKKVDLLNEMEKNKIKAVAGHYFYGIHQHFSKPYNYFTLLRDPVDRVISSYYFLQDFAGHERLKNMTLEEFVVNEHRAHNLQSALISGIRRKPDINKAKKNLQSFSVVGVTEMFDDTLFLLKKEFNWKDIRYTKQNITKKRLSKEEIPASVIDLIKEHNSLDIELYDFAKQLLHEKLATLTEDERKQLQKFKQRQRLLS